MKKVSLLSLAFVVLSVRLGSAQIPSQPTEGVSCAPLSWVTKEYLLWQIENGPSPPLATTGDIADPVSGALGQPGTSILFAGNGLEYGSSSGGRLTFGGWLSPQSEWGWEASGFVLERQSVNFFAASGPTGTPTLYVPIINQDPTDPNFGNEGAFIIGEPIHGKLGGFSGNLSISSTTQLWGVEINSLFKSMRVPDIGLDLLFGFRHLNLAEDLNLGGLQNDFVLDIQNRFNEGFGTRNLFFGPQLGAKLNCRLSARLWLDVLGKVALGVCHQSVDIHGTSVFSGTGFGAPQTFTGAVLTQPTNVGKQDGDRFAVVPQLQAKVGFDLTSRLRGTCAFDFLYFSSVVRPGDQIDRNINFSQAGGDPLKGQPFPRPRFQTSDFVAHGVSWGLEYRY